MVAGCRIDMHRATEAPTRRPRDLSVTPGSIDVSDDCGGRAGTTELSENGFASGNWLPPVNAGLCHLTVRAINGDGGTGSMTAAILVRRGTAATARPPQLFIQLLGSGIRCNFGNGSGTDCGSLPAGSPVLGSTAVNWSDGLPFSITLTDSCGGGERNATPNQMFSFDPTWVSSGQSGTMCTLTVNASNLQGVTSQASAQYHLQ